MPARVIAFDATPLCRNVSGIGRYTHNLIKAYAAANPNTTVYLLCFVGDTFNTAYTLTEKNIQVHTIPIPRKIYQFSYRRLLRIPCDLFLRHLNIDTIICSNFVIFPYVKTIPTIVVIHDLAYLRHPETIEQKNLKYLTKHVPKSLKEATRVTTISRFTQTELREAFSNRYDQISVISCGIDATTFNQNLKKRDGSILAVGTLEPRKNLAKLLAAYELLPSKVQAAHPLKIVGATGWGTGPSSRNKNIYFLGYVSDTELRRLYGSCSLFAFPSIYEGFGIPILEAFASGTPVVCSDIPPFREVAKTHALYFDPNDETSIAKKIVVALKSSLQPRTDDYSSVIKSWSWQKSAKQLQKLIESL